MKPFYSRFLVFGILVPAIFLVLHNNCSDNRYLWSSTDNGSVIAGNPMALASNKILTAVCGVVTRCHPEVTDTQCELGVRQVDGMALPLGLQPWGYNTLSSIQQAEAAGMIQGQSTSANSCSSEISALDCSSPPVQAAYDASASQPFSGASKLVTGTSCSGSFAPARAGPPCPSNYVLVPPLVGYATSSFCVAKYEMKNVSGLATSAAANGPWTLISRDQSISTCRALGANFDLISNTEWQTVARNIADQPVNWNTGVPYSGELNRGYSDDLNGAPQAASSDDTKSCTGTLQSCSSTIWNSQRRTHVLSNGGIVWDLAGNVWEWVSDNNPSSQGPDDAISSLTAGDARQALFGNDQVCPSGRCGFGYGLLNYSGGAILRGDTYGGGTGAGVFAVDLRYGPAYADSIIGFRCVYRPPQ